MTEPSRREKLEAMLEASPDDAFLRYALAMELDKLGRRAECLSMLRELAAGEPPHTAACFMAAQRLAPSGELEEARALLRRGIEAARQAGDTHAAGEMSELLAQLGAAGE